MIKCSFFFFTEIADAICGKLKIGIRILYFISSCMANFFSGFALILNMNQKPEAQRYLYILSFSRISSFQKSTLFIKLNLCIFIYTRFTCIFNLPSILAQTLVMLRSCAFIEVGSSVILDRQFWLGNIRDCIRSQKWNRERDLER